MTRTRAMKSDTDRVALQSYVAEQLGAQRAALTEAFAEALEAQATATATAMLEVAEVQKEYIEQRLEQTAREIIAHIEAQRLHCRARRAIANWYVGRIRPLVAELGLVEPRVPLDEERT